MLKPEELQQALVNAQRSSARCGRMCTVGGRVSEQRYAVYHNGVGGRDTDAVVVFAGKVLELDADKLTARLGAWLIGLHAGARVDLNEAAT